MLDALNRVYPSGLQNGMLYRIVLTTDPTYDHDLLKKDLFYLKGKGYIEFIDDALGGTVFMKKVAQLTANGKDVADKITVDATLEF